MLFGHGLLYYQVYRQTTADAERDHLPTPQRLLDALPRVSDKVHPNFGEVENKWAALTREFVADIRGEPHQSYLTFYEGWRYQEAIDAVRSGSGWRELPV